MMKQSWLVLVAAALACEPAPVEDAAQPGALPAAEAAITAEPVRFEGGTTLGEPLTIDRLTDVAEILARPQEYVGQRVLVKGQVTAVCAEQGCWMDILTGTGGDTIQIKVDDGVIVFPQDALGKEVLAEGTVEELEQTQQEALEAAQHRAEEQGTKFDPASVTGPVTKYRIRGLGVQIAP